MTDTKLVGRLLEEVGIKITIFTKLLLDDLSHHPEESYDVIIKNLAKREMCRRERAKFP